MIYGAEPQTTEYRVILQNLGKNVREKNVLGLNIWKDMSVVKLSKTKNVHGKIVQNKLSQTLFKNKK